MSRWAYGLLLLPTIALAGIVTHGARLYVASESESSCEGAVDGFQPEEGFCLIGTSIGHGERVTLTLEGGGFGSGPSKVLDDRVSNISAYSSLGEGDRIPTTTGYPYSDNTPLGEGEVQYSETNLRHANQSANYKWDGAGTLEWPQLFGADEAPANQLTMYGRMWIIRTTTGTGTGDESSKYFRVWDSSEGVGTRISYGSLNLTVHDGEGLDDGSEGAGLMPVGDWHLLEIYVDADVEVRTYLDGEATGFYTGTFKNSSQSGRGFNFKVLGWDIGGDDPTYAQWHMSDIYLADSRARVVIADSANWASVTSVQEVQIPAGAGWSDEEIEFDMLFGQFGSSLAGRHLHVRTANGSGFYAGAFN